MNVMRLTKLAELMDRTPVERLAMGDWHCGSASCAVGSACLDQEFNEMGLQLVSGMPQFDGKHNWHAVTSFFDITQDQAHYLFDGDQYAPNSRAGSDGQMYDNDQSNEEPIIIHPSAVAERIRAFIKNEGQIHVQ